MLALTPYRDRIEAGQALAKQLGAYAAPLDTVVLALPEGGVPVALEIARRLGVPLDVFSVRPLSASSESGGTIGAIASGGIRVLDRMQIDDRNVTFEEIDEATLRELKELERAELIYRQGRPALELEMRTVILVDDGLADEVTLHAALIALRHHAPAEIVMALPVGDPEICAHLAVETDDLVCPLRPTPFHAAGLWYAHFPPTSEIDVRKLLEAAPKPPAPNARRRGMGPPR